jgi:hypothetical protein
VNGAPSKGYNQIAARESKIAKERKKLTEEHRKVIDEAGANFTRLYEEIYAKSAIPRQEVCNITDDLMLPGLGRITS